jgi:antitoxin component YwqK of YwqJK toxin-antitoxin module
MLKQAAYFLLVVLLFSLGSCRINRYKDGLRTGLWISNTDNADVIYKSRGRYTRGKEKGTWKFFQYDTLYQKDKYSGNHALVTFYHSNKMIRSTGRTQLDLTAKQIHWYYTGDWKYFDSQGKLIKVVTYKDGNPISDVNSD